MSLSTDSETIRLVVREAPENVPLGILFTLGGKLEQRHRLIPNVKTNCSSASTPIWLPRFLRSFLKRSAATRRSGFMTDVLSKAKRSALMAKVRGLGNASTELRLVRLLREHRITGWRRGTSLLGKPDFVFRAQKVAVFVDGCFWHGCPRHGRTPKTRVAFWTAKLARNAQRDRAVSRALRAAGWTVLRVWECALARARTAQTAARIARYLDAPALFAQAPAATNLLPAEFPKNRQTNITVPIPAGTKNLQCSVTVYAPDFRKMPLQGYGVGVWFRFHNEAGEALKNNGQVPGNFHGPLGFALGVERKTTKPKTEEKKVAVPPGATKIEVRVTPFSNNGTATVSGPDGFTVDAVSVTPVP